MVIFHSKLLVYRKVFPSQNQQSLRQLLRLRHLPGTALQAPRLACEAGGAMEIASQKRPKGMMENDRKSPTDWFFDSKSLDHFSPHRQFG